MIEVLKGAVDIVYIFIEKIYTIKIDLTDNLIVNVGDIFVVVVGIIGTIVLIFKFLNKGDD